VAANPDEIAWAAQLACLYEAGADKPGNVSPRAPFGDARYEDFVAGAVAVGPAFRDAGRAAVGATVLRAVTDTRRLVATNTNLGIVLLLAPLAAAAAARAPGEGLRDAVRRVLRDLTVEDARDAYAAIALAAPAGLGRVEEHDVAGGAPPVTLLAAMELARERDAVAAEYATGYAATFEVGEPELRRAWGAGSRFSDAIVSAFLTLLAGVPDSLIARKRGAACAADVSRRAGEVLAAGGPSSAEGRAGLEAFDRFLRDEAHGLNPGSTADLTCAALFVFLTEGGMLERAAELSARW
jgi:triphosphoribosyl-dephospho-CoA synthase